MHFSSFCTTNYVPLERFDIIYTTVSLKPLVFFFLTFVAKRESLKKKHSKNYLKFLTYYQRFRRFFRVIPQHSQTHVIYRAFILGRASFPTKSRGNSSERARRRNGKHFSEIFQPMPASSSSILAFLRFEVRI